LGTTIIGFVRHTHPAWPVTRKGRLQRGVKTNLIHKPFEFESDLSQQFAKSLPRVISWGAGGGAGLEGDTPDFRPFLRRLGGRVNDLVETPWNLL